ncbi:MAG: hypothetical protein ABGZ35_00720, partial [Planctomycetaceae bacterium]
NISNHISDNINNHRIPKKKRRLSDGIYLLDCIDPHVDLVREVIKMIPDPGEININNTHKMITETETATLSATARSWRATCIKMAHDGHHGHHHTV